MRKHRAEQARRAKEQPGADKPGRKAPSAAVAAPPKGATPRRIATEDGRKYSQALMVHHDRGGDVAEQYRVLRTGILAKCPKGKLATLITSAEPGEGKTVTCLNLAFVLAERQEYRIMVVDFDLRKGRISVMLGQSKQPGLADVLRGSAQLADVTRPTVYPNVDYVPAGKAKHDEIGELLASPQVHDLFGQLRRRYDFVLVDTPPVNTAADVGMLGGIVDQAMLVVRMDRTSRDSVDRAIRLLRSANIEVSGLVLTHHKSFVPRYFYRYA